MKALFYLMHFIVSQKQEVEHQTVSCLRREETKPAELSFPHLLFEDMLYPPM